MKKIYFLILSIFNFFIVFNVYTNIDLWHLDSENADDLVGVNYSGNQYLSNYSFRFAYMKNANLSKVNAKKTLFEHANLTGAYFGESDFEQADFSYAILKDVKFQSPSYLKLCEILRKVRADGITCPGIFFDLDTDAQPVNFTKANFTGVDFRGLDLTGVIFCNANFKDAIFDETTLVNGADFSEAKNLTNEQKKFLHEHGALHVPYEIDFEIDQESENVGTEIKPEDKPVSWPLSWGRKIQKSWVRLNSEDEEIQIK